MGVLPVKVDGKDVWPCRPAMAAAVDGAAEQRHHDLVDRRRQVVLVSRPFRLMPVFKGTIRQFDARQDCATRSERGSADRDEAGIVDLARHICPADDRCRLKIDGVTLRIDGLHFRGDDELVSRWLVPRVLSAAGERRRQRSSIGGMNGRRDETGPPA